MSHYLQPQNIIFEIKIKSFTIEAFKESLKLCLGWEETFCFSFNFKNSTA
jgi:hypothetical protein